MARVRKEWHGDELALRVHRASGRAIIAVGEQVALETKRLTHVISGTLARSVHTAPVGYDGSRDEQQAAVEDMMFAEGTNAVSRAIVLSEGVDKPAVEVGSWLPYACAEWVGRGHPGVTQGLEAARPMSDSIVKKSFTEEGL